jgi:hypothetical protein
MRSIQVSGSVGAGCAEPLSGGPTEPKGAVLAQPGRCRQRLPGAGGLPVLGQGRWRTDASPGPCGRNAFLSGGMLSGRWDRSGVADTPAKIHRRAGFPGNAGTTAGRMGDHAVSPGQVRDLPPNVQGLRGAAGHDLPRRGLPGALAGAPVAADEHWGAELALPAGLGAAGAGSASGRPRKGSGLPCSTRGMARGRSRCGGPCGRPA